MPTKLNEIMARTESLVRDRKSRADFKSLERQAADHTPRGFAAALRAASNTRPAVIAECKRASPSKGLLREHYRPAEIARAYQTGGAAAISVLTEPDFFSGSLADLTAVSSAVAIPVLRKDFMLDEFQILEARAAGADAILLIVAALLDDQMRELALAARNADLDILCEVHNREELTRALDLGCQMLGVNCRNLKTLEVDLDVHTDLAEFLPQDIVRVAESGIRTLADIERLLGEGYNAFLVGEALMSQPDPGAGLAQLIGR